MSKRLNVVMTPGSAHGALMAFHARQFEQLGKGEVDPAEVLELPDNFLEFLSTPWVTSALPGGIENGCMACSHMNVICGVMVPFLHDVGAIMGTDSEFMVTDEGFRVRVKGGNELLAIKEFAIWCSDGASQNLQVRLVVDLFTEEGVKTEHVWKAPLPEPGWFRNKRPLLSSEVANLLKNDLYPEVTRELLQALMDRLCVGGGRLFRSSIKTHELAEQGGDTIFTLFS